MEADKFIDEMIEYLKEDIEAFEEDKLNLLSFCDNNKELERSQKSCDDYIQADKNILNLLEHYKTTKEGPKEYYKAMIEKIASDIKREDK